MRELIYEEYVPSMSRLQFIGQFTSIQFIGGERSEVRGIAQRAQLMFLRVNCLGWHPVIGQKDRK